MERMQNDFGYFTTPFYPKNYHSTKKTLHDNSKPFQIIHQYYEQEELKDNLPHSSGYLLIQLSDDEQYLFCGLMFINKERKLVYNVTKLALSGVDRQKLFKMIETLA